LAKGKAMKAVAAALVVVIVLSLGALIWTSSGILVHQSKTGEGYFCRYFTGTGTFTTPSHAVAARDLSA
jgi:hypothetical protein